MVGPGLYENCNAVIIVSTCGTIVQVQVVALILRTKRPHLIGGVWQAAIGDQLSIQPHP